MFNRRRFINKLFSVAGAIGLSSWTYKPKLQHLKIALDGIKHKTELEIVQDETFWYQIKNAYSVSPALINLNNGGVSPQPRIVQEAVEHYNRWGNETPSYYMWRHIDAGKEPLRRRLADLAGCSPDEIAINRNATEGLETVIFGMTLKPGDEVVHTKQDYPSMINAWKQRAKRDGIVLKTLSFDFPIEDKQEIINAFTQAFTAKTKVVHITHMINWIGQILPVKEIAQAAHDRGIEVIVDAAHTFGQLPYSIPELECDYWATSLHKWLCAPFGSGMLYVKKEKIANLYPLFAADEPESDNIRKFEHLGTRSIAIEQAIGQAIDFHLMIGTQLKYNRLHYLKNYWMEGIKNHPGVSLHTSFDPEFAGAIGLFSIEGKTPQEIASILQREHRIHTVGIEWENISGVRVTPNVYTVIKDLDAFVAAVKSM